MTSRARRPGRVPPAVPLALALPGLPAGEPLADVARPGDVVRPGDAGWLPGAALLVDAGWLPGVALPVDVA
jgi:hypothetical protein